MEDIPESYQLETIEQMRAIADDFRLRIVEVLGQQAMTVTQLGKLLGEVPAKIHYHVGELEKVGLVRLVETRENNKGILEKYYRAIAKEMSVSETLLQRAQPDETIAAVRETFQQVSQGFIQALTDTLHRQAWNESMPPHFAGEQLWMTGQEYRQLIKQMHTLMEPYQAPRSLEGERELSFVQIIYPAQFASAQETGATPTPTATAMPPAPATPAPAEQAGIQMTPSPSPTRRSDAPARRHIVATLGMMMYSRKDLERVIARGEQLNILLAGYCHFADDITPDLIERAIGRFRFRGKLSASPEVREALKRKEGRLEEREKQGN
jgi:hypothetical protein